jgi:hypothetical protein
MTIDAKNSVRIANANIRSYSKPQGIVSNEAWAKRNRYDGRLFFCPDYVPKTSVSGCPGKAGFATAKSERKDRNKPRENVEKLCISLAFKADIYYNNVLYNVVGPRLMQGLAKLRKVAEVSEVGSDYLKLPQIANSKRILLAT